jgi:glycosyltransferase involved in cell wall biosynthesis
MRVLHYKPTMRAEEGGVVKAVFDLCLLTASERVGVGLATYHTDLVRSNLPDGCEARLTLHGVDLPHAATRLLSRADLVAMREVIAGYDLVHLHTIWTPSNTQITRICRSLGIPYVVTVHGMLDDWCMTQSRLKKRIYLATWGRGLIPGAARVHATSEAEREQIGRHASRGDCVSIPLPVNLDAYARLPGAAAAFDRFAALRSDRPIVLFLSRIHHKKGLERLIRASAMLHGRGVDHQLAIAGTGERRYVDSVRELARSLGVADSTAFLGFVDGPEKIALFQAASVFALPTSQENFGFVFFESLAAGTPVVTTRGADTWGEILRSGGGSIVDNTPDAFADAIGPLLGAPDHAREMGQRARAWALDRFDQEKIIAAYEQMYAACLEGIR